MSTNNIKTLIYHNLVFITRRVGAVLDNYRVAMTRVMLPFTIALSWPEGVRQRAAIRQTRTKLTSTTGLKVGAILLTMPWAVFLGHAQNPPTISVQPISTTNLLGSSVTFSVSVDGTGPFTYQWRFNGTNLQNIITTVAGNGNYVYSGDGGVATNAGVEPTSVTLDAAGNLFIADGQGRVRKVDTNGVITTIAGNGIYTFSGDGGPAVNASVYNPHGVAFDTSDNLFVADTDNNRVRMVDTNGVISTVAGIGPSYPSGGWYSGDGGAATNASLNFPHGITLDSAGNLFIADTSNHRIRKVDASGVITSVAGDAPAGLPYEDAGSFSGDGGAATNAGLNSPAGVAFDAIGEMLIADSGNNRIREVNTNGIITTVVGNGNATYAGDGGTATNASLNNPQGVAFDTFGNLFIADAGNNCIREVNTNGMITTAAGNGSAAYSGDGGAATNAGLWFPSSVNFDADGNLYIADAGNYRVREVHFTDNPSLVLNKLSRRDVGDYSVVVSNPYGSVTSVVATLTLANDPPSILDQPTNREVQAGSDVTLSVNATGTEPLYYLWIVDGTNLVQSTTNSTLTLSNFNALNVGQYKVVVTNEYGSAASQHFALVLAPSLNGQPLSHTSLVGSNVTFSVEVDGTGPFTYQWQCNGTNLTDNIISTVAGGGSNNPGDGGAATNASLNAVFGVAADNQGNYYIADYGFCRVRKVDTNGDITTVAGNGTYAHSGDGGQATNASLYSPDSVAVDSQGNVYIAEYIGSCIRKVDTNGIITTVAGNGTVGYSGDGGQATNASLNYPEGVAVGPFGNLFIADSGNNRIREVSTNGVITTVAGNGTAGFSGDGGSAINAGLNSPSGVAFDDFGNLLIADSGNNRVREVSTNGVITTIAGNGAGGFTGDGGVATNASLTRPYSVAVDRYGYLFIADRGNNRVRQVDLNSIITTAAGNGLSSYSGDGGAATNANLNYPTGVAPSASGGLLIADEWNYRVRELTLGRSPELQLNNVSSNIAGNYDVIISGPYGGSVTSSVVTLTVVYPPSISLQPQSVVVTNGNSADFTVIASGSGSLGYQWYFNRYTPILNQTNGALHFAEVGTNQAGFYDCVISNAYGSATSSVVALTVLSEPGIGVQPINQIAISGATAVFNVGAFGSGPITYQWQFNGTNLPSENDVITTVAGTSGQSGFSGDGGPATNAVMLNPSGVAVDALGDIFIADKWNNRIRKVDTNGLITTVAGIGPTSVGGSYSGDGGMATNAGLNLPEGVAVDSSGNLYIADTGNNRIRKVDTSGIITTIAGNGTAAYSGDGGFATNASLRAPMGVAVDSSGNVFIADEGNNRIREVNTNRIITTVAGNGTAGFSGDGGAATNASLNQPYGVAADHLGNLFVADYSNNRIREIGPNGIITTLAGSGNAGYSGDGGAATNASLNQPYGVAVDGFDDVFIADYANNRVRMVGITGTISTVAGTGIGGYSGDGGLATNANLYEPNGVGVDANGDLFVTGNYYSTARKINLGGVPTLQFNNVTAANMGNYDVIVTSPYGSVTSSVVTLTVVFRPSITAQPYNIAVTNGGGASFSVAASGTKPLVYQWYYATNTLIPGETNADLSIPSVNSSKAGDYFCVVTNDYGSVTSRVVTLSLAIGVPPSIALQPTNQTVISGNTITFVTAVSGTGPFTYQWQFNGVNVPNDIITTVAGNGTTSYAGNGLMATNTGLSGVADVCFDQSGNLYISDRGNNCIRLVNSNGIITSVAGNGRAGFSGDGQAATNASLNQPSGISVDSDGNLFFADRNNNRIREVSTNGSIRTVAGNGLPYYTGDGSAATNAGLALPFGVTADDYGDLYIADQENNRIRQLDSSGIITTVAGNGPSYPGFFGGFSGDGGPATNAQLYYPSRVAVDAAGNIFIADQRNNSIRKVDASGTIIMVAGNGSGGFSGDGGAATNASLLQPCGVAVDAAGNLFIADQSNNRIREVSTNGIITTIAGNGTAAYSGDGGPATNASLYYPDGLAFDAAGNLFIADQRNNRVREVALAGTPTLTTYNATTNDAGNYSVIVRSPYGSVTSSVVSLTVILSPKDFEASRIAGGSVQLHLNGTPGHAYILQTATNLAPPINWQSIVTNIADANGNWYFTDTNFAQFPQRFYRASP